MKRSRAAPRAPRTTVAAQKEVKYFDTFANVLMTSGVASWTDAEVSFRTFYDGDGAIALAQKDLPLNPSTVGSGYGEVNGNTYLLKKLHVRGTLHVDSFKDEVNAPVPARCRVMLVQAINPSGAIPNASDVMSRGGNATQFAFQNSSQTPGRFVILKDWTTRLRPIVAPTDGIETDPVSANTFGVSFDDDYFDFEWIPRIPLQVSIVSNSADPNFANHVTSSFFMLCHTLGNDVGFHAACRCYYCD